MIPRRYPSAIWKGAAWQNYSTTPITPRLGILHVVQGDEAGIVPWFHDPRAIVSAHLFNPKEGPMLQFVDLLEEAYAECAFNGESWSMEHEGYSGERMTHGQAERFRLFAVCAKKVAGIPYTWRPDAFHGPGWTSHGDLGIAGGDHINCPGPGIVEDARAILDELRRPVRLLLAPTPRA
jgi:hypothetical protein